VLVDDFEGPGSKYQELHNRPMNVRDPFIKDLREKCEEALREDFAHVAGYHACRTTDPDSYRRCGVLASSQERLEEEAREIFDNIQGLENAIAASAVYFQMYEGSVSLYTTAKRAPICQRQLHFPVVVNYTSRFLVIVSLLCRGEGWSLMPPPWGWRRA
jgi:hypothetical protein